MADLAKVLGAFCMLVGLGWLLLAVFALGSLDSTQTSDAYWGGATLLVVALASAAVLFGTIGAAAYVVGDLAEDAAARRAARERRADARDRPYGASTRI